MGRIWGHRDMEKRTGHTGIEHIFTCIYIDSTHTYIYIEVYMYYTDVFIGNSLSIPL